MVLIAIIIGVIVFFSLLNNSGKNNNNVISSSNHPTYKPSYIAPCPITSTITYTIPAVKTRPGIIPILPKDIIDIPFHTALKENHMEFINLLKQNGIAYLYHFTDRRNIESIKKHGGLYSWSYCDQHNIHIPFAGGNYDSRVNDIRYGLQDYVRLSFCDDHPMMWRLQQAGYDLILLKIKIDTAVFADTLFSDMNATDRCHHHGNGIEDLKCVRFAATRRHYVRREDEDFKFHQAEIMVKTFIPLK